MAGGQRREHAELVPMPRLQPAGALFQIRQSPEPVQLRLEDPVRMIEGRIEACQRHRCHVREIHLFPLFLAIGLNSPSVL
jgi:hypothetical protein